MYLPNNKKKEALFVNGDLAETFQFYPLYKSVLPKVTTLVNVFYHLLTFDLSVTGIRHLTTLSIDCVADTSEYLTRNKISFPSSAAASVC